jgi:hypothetical protein
LLDPKPNRPRPEYAPDGILAGDYRLVRKSGRSARLKCFGDWWESDKLIPFIGKWVWVDAGGYWIVSIRVYSKAYTPENFICEIGERRRR